MGYNPHHYKHLFKKGLESLPDKEFDNWNQSHLLFALNQQRQRKMVKKLAKGLWIKRGSIDLGKGFANYVVFEIDLTIRKLHVHHVYRPVYPLGAFGKLRSVKVLLNLGYFYLSTYEDLDPVPPPRIRASGLVITDGRLEETIRLTLDWYTPNENWWKKIKSGEYRKNYEMIYGKYL